MIILEKPKKKKELLMDIVDKIVLANGAWASNLIDLAKRYK